MTPINQNTTGLSGYGWHKDKVTGGEPDRTAPINQALTFDASVLDPSVTTYKGFKINQDTPDAYTIPKEGIYEETLTINGEVVEKRVGVAPFYQDIEEANKSVIVAALLKTGHFTIFEAQDFLDNVLKTEQKRIAKLLAFELGYPEKELLKLMERKGYE